MNSTSKREFNNKERKRFADFANIEEKLYFYTRNKKVVMEIIFGKEYLKELYYKGKSSDKKHRYQPQVVKGYVKALNIMDSVERIEDLFRYKSLHYEKLQGDEKGLESVRANDQYRIEFQSSVNGEITICNIIELSNHYK